MDDDTQLLRIYAGAGSEPAFNELVTRHIDLVFSAALRQVAGDTHLAQDVTQMVFADLARKASSLSRHQVLTGWLYQATRVAAAKAVRTARRRAIREKESVAMQEPSADANWEQLAPLLDEAMDSMRRVVQQMQGGRISNTERLGEHGIKIQFDANQTDGAAVSNEIIFARQDIGWKVALTVFKENDLEGVSKLRTVFPLVPEQVVSAP